jgi:putative ABC transport system permease protein
LEATVSAAERQSPRLVRRLGRWLRRRRWEGDLSEEMAFHRAMTAQRLEDEGLAPGAAAAAAQRAFGSAALAADRARDVWTPPWIQDIARDIRFAVRLLARERAFTIAVVVVLGLGIGTASLQFVLVDAVCLRGLPIPDVGRVLFLGARDASRRDVALSYREFDRIRSASPAFEGAAAFASAPAVLGDDDRAPDRALATFASAALFDTLRERPQLGRGFDAADDRPGAAPVAVLSSGMWRARYAADPSVVGRLVRVNGTPTTIVGVMRAPFRFPNVTDVWLPLAAMPGILSERRAARALNVIARTRDEAALPALRSALTTESTGLARDYPATNAGVSLTAVGINERYQGRLTDSVWIAFMLVAAIVLLIACANAANMLLLRASARSHEIAVRASLGASRWRIVRQLLVESTLLAALGGGFGAALAGAGLRGINGLIPDNTLAYWMRFALDLRALAGLCAICGAAVVVFGLAPALHVARADVNDAIKSGGRGGFGVVRGRRWTAICLAAECGLTMVMLAALVVAVRTARDAGRRFVAIEPASTLSSWVTLPADRYRSPDARRDFYRALQQRVAAIPGAASVALTTALPLGGAAARTVGFDDRPTPTPAPTAWTLTISERYFDALGLAIARGRAFGDRDDLPGYEAAIVSRRFADMFFPGSDPLGRRFRLGDDAAPSAAATPLTIVGVAPPIRQRPQATAPDPLVYLPIAATPPVSAALLIRSSADAVPTAAALSDATRAVDPELPLYRTMPLDAAIEGSQWNGRVSEWLLNSITVVAVGLAGLGLYAVIAQAVVQRRREIGIRIALGASRRRVVSLVARHSALHFALGVAAGIGCVFEFARLTAGDGGGENSGYQITSASTLIAVAALLAIITTVASIAPAWRACRVDPAQTLRES